MSETNFHVQIESVGPCTLQVVIEPSEERVQQAMRAVAREISEHQAIPGFRKGKAPYSAILRLYGEDLLRQEAAERLSVELLADVVQKNRISLFGPAHLKQRNLDPMRFTYTLYQPPNVRLGDYRSLRIAPPAVEVTEEEVAQALERIRQEAAVLEPVEGRGAQQGDVVVITVEGRNSEGQTFLQEQSAEITLDPDDPYPAPGFHRALEGMTPGETRTFRLELPPEQGGGEGEFHVRLEALYKRILPDLDDDLARTVGPYNSLEALREDLRQQIRAQKEEVVQERYSLQVIDRLVEESQIEYPPVMLEDRLDDLIQDMEENIRNRFRLSLQDYLRASGQTMENLREQLTPAADQLVRRTLVLRAVAEAEGLEVSEEEIEQAIRSISEAWGDQGAAIQRIYQDARQRERLSNRLLYDKIVSRLVAIARGEYVPETPTEAGNASL